MKQQQQARLVNIISDFALMGFPGKTVYAASKSAIMGFTNCLTTELAGTTVKASLVIPPPMNTGIVKNGKHSSDSKKEKEMAFLKKNGMPPEEAARRITRQVQQGKYRIVVGAMMFWIDTLSRLFPSLVHWFTRKNKHRFDFI